MELLSSAFPLYDESRTVLERLRIVCGFLLRGDALRFVPTLQVFLARHPEKDMGDLERLVPYLHDPSPEVATRISWLLQSQGGQPRNVRRAIEDHEREKPKRDMFEQLTSR